MASSTLNAIVVSQRSLVRELLGDHLRVRHAARVISSFIELDDCRAQLSTANLLIVDAHGITAGARSAFLASASNKHPHLRVVVIEDSKGDFSVEDFARTVLGLRRTPAASSELLTPLESEVLLAVASGQRNAEVARRMRRSTKTVEKHRANLLRKLGLRSVAQLTAYAIRNGLLNADAILARRQT